MGFCFFVLCCCERRSGDRRERAGYLGEGIVDPGPHLRDLQHGRAGASVAKGGGVRARAINEEGRAHPHDMSGIRRPSSAERCETDRSFLRSTHMRTTPFEMEGRSWRLHGGRVGDFGRLRSATEGSVRGWPTAGTKERASCTASGRAELALSNVSAIRSRLRCHHLRCPLRICVSDGCWSRFEGAHKYTHSCRALEGALQGVSCAKRYSTRDVGWDRLLRDYRV